MFIWFSVPRTEPPVLHPEISERLHEYLAGIFDEIDSHSLKIGSATDHVHS